MYFAVTFHDIKLLVLNIAFSPKELDDCKLYHCVLYIGNNFYENT